MLVINGASGEGGGQILRTALALSLVTGQPFRIEQIRANRKRPGLRPQHLTAVNAAAQVGEAEVQGDRLGSQTLVFIPRGVHPGVYHFEIGTAGSCTLVLQTILPALSCAQESSELTLEGGTHNPLAPSFEFLAEAFLPLLAQMGTQVTVCLDRPGFYPAGGGKIRVVVMPVVQLSPLELLTRGMIMRQMGHAIVANLPAHIGERELKIVRQRLGWPSRDLMLEEVPQSHGPGNVLTLTLACEHITEVFTGFGERGVPAERVAGRAVDEVQEYLQADVPVGRHLADQLILPLALAGKGIFRTLTPTPHTLTNIDVVKQFLAIDVTIRPLNDQTCEIELRRNP